MKKVLAMLLASSMILSFAACGDKPEETTTGETTTAETTTAEKPAAETTTAESTTEAPVVVAPVAEDSLDFLRKVWNAYVADDSISEEEKLLFVGGGDYTWLEQAGAEFEANNPMPSDDASDAEWEAYWNAYAAATQGPGRVAPEYDEENNPYLASVNFPVAHVGLIDSAASVFHGMMLNNFTCATYHVADSANVDTLVNALKTSIGSAQWVCGQPEVYTIITVGNYVTAIYGLEMITDDITSTIEGLFDNATVVCKEAVM